MHRAALIKLVQEIVTRALINFKWYVEERRLSVNTTQTRNRTLKLYVIREHINTTEDSNYDAANVHVETGRRRVHQIDTRNVHIVTVIYLMK
jgi:hypothetical protein